MEEEDDFGFMPSGKSRLSALFPTSSVNEDDVNQSLTYVAPKQPKKNSSETSMGSSGKNLILLHVVSAYTYKLEGGKYVNVGKLGVAVLGNTASSVYKLLLYKGKSQHITMCSITINFQFCIENNNYAKFPDDKGDNWSVMFNSEKELITFAKHIAIARVNSSGNVPTKLVVQDLVAGEGRTVKNGDSVDLIYTGWLFVDKNFGEVFDDNEKTGKPFIIQLGKTKVIKGLSEGLMGVKKHSRRLLIIPPNLAYGADGIPKLVPPDSTLIFELYVKKVKIPRDTSASPSPSRKGSESKPEVPPRTQSINEDTIRSRGASISEQLTQSPRKDNAKLISRMAKMGGLPTLPIHSTVTAQTSSESDPEKEHENEQYDRKQSSSSPNLASGLVQKEVEVEERKSPPVHHRRRNLSSPKQSLSPQLQPLQVSSLGFSTYPSSYPLDSTSFIQQSMQAHAITPIMPPIVSNTLENHIPLLVTETRTQNTEVRMTLGKIIDKVDTVIQKLDDGKYQSEKMSSAFHRQVPYMEGAILAQNIERIIQENAQLKKDGETKNSKIQELNEKICDILQRNQRFFEESNSILEQRSDSLQMTTSQLQNKILSLEQEKAKLSSKLSEQEFACSAAEAKANKYQKLHEEMSKQFVYTEDKNKEHYDLVTSLREKCSNSESVIRLLEEKMEEVQQHNDELNQKLTKTEEQLRSSKKSEEFLRIQLEERAASPSVSEAQNEVQLWKKKYDNLHENARILKEKYEKQIILLTSEVRKLKNAVPPNVSGEPRSQDFASEIKKAMNSVYKILRSEIKPDENYPGSEILHISLSIIQRVTLSLIEKSQQQQVPENIDLPSVPADDEQAQVQEKTESFPAEPKEAASEQPKQPETAEDVPSDVDASGNHGDVLKIEKDENKTDSENAGIEEGDSLVISANSGQVTESDTQEKDDAASDVFEVTETGEKTSILGAGDGQEIETTVKEITDRKTPDCTSVESFMKYLWDMSAHNSSFSNCPRLLARKHFLQMAFVLLLVLILYAGSILHDMETPASSAAPF